MNLQLWIQIWGFVIAIILILSGIMFNRQDVKELRSEMSGRIDGLRGDLGGKIDRLQIDLNGRIDHLNGRMDHLQRDLTQFYRAIGQHDGRIDNLEKRA